MRIKLIVIVSFFVIGCRQEVQSQQQSADQAAENGNVAAIIIANETGSGRMQDQVVTGRFTGITRAVEIA